MNEIECCGSGGGGRFPLLTPGTVAVSLFH